MEIQLLKAAVKETIKETITEIITAARRHQSAWLGRKRDRKGQGYDSSSSIIITHTITQTTSQATTPELPPLISYVHPFARRDRAWSPSLLTIDSEIEFSPEGSPPGAALGIPPEHILDEDPSPIDGPIPLNFAKAAAPVSVWGADNYMVHKLSSFDGASSIVSFASHLGGIGEGDESPNNGSRRPSSTTLGAFGVRMVAQNEQRETIEDATMSLPEQQSSLSDDVLFFSLPNRAQDLPAAASSLPSAQNLSTSRLYQGQKGDRPRLIPLQSMRNE